MASRSMTRPALGDVLVEQGIVPKLTVEQTLSRLGGVTAELGATLLGEGAVSEEQLARALSIQFGLPFDALTDFRVEPSFYDSISVKLMQRHPFVPIAELQGRLRIAIPDPQDLFGIDELELLLGRELELVISPKSAILTALERSEGSSQALRELEAEYRSVLVKEDERGEEILTLDQSGEDQSPAVKLLDSILLSAMQRRASDIHVEAADRSTRVKFRVDGILVSAMEPLDIRLHASTRLSIEGHVGSGYCGTAGSAGRQFPDAAGAKDRRFSGLDLAERIRRVGRHPHLGP